jgi:peptidyl-tRNA hydrolase
VLDAFFEDETPLMEKVIDLSKKACEVFVTEGIAAAMNRINGENLAPSDASSAEES